MLDQYAGNSGKLNCSGCSECCKWITFEASIPPPVYKRKIEYFNRRGCVVRMMENRFFVTVPSVCPQLLGSSCKIYDKRPEACRDYDCRRDPFLPGGNYKK